MRWQFLVLGSARCLSAVTRSCPDVYGVSERPFFVSVAVLLGAVALAANYFLAQRAVKIDPMVALRYE